MWQSDLTESTAAEYDRKINIAGDSQQRHLWSSAVYGHEYWQRDKKRASPK